MAVLTLTDRDRAILATLSGPCRFATVEQLARSFWTSSKAPVSDARKRLTALEDAGLIDSRIIMAHPEIDLVGPVFTWPGGVPEQLGGVAYRVNRRWSRPLEATRVVLASDETRQHLSARPGRLIRRSETTHDVHLAAVFLTYRERDPEAAARWVSGDELQSDAFEKVPDAVIRNDRGGIARVIEFAGSYSAGKLRAIHQEYSRFPYELW